MSAAVCALALALFSAAVGEPVTPGLEAEEFHYHGDWTFGADKSGHSGPGFLFANPKGARLPAATVI